MKLQKKVSLGQFAKVKEDYKDGDMLKIIDAGTEVEGEFGTQTVFKVELPLVGIKNMSFNQTSKNHLIEAFGNDTEEWIGKEIKAWVIKQNVSGKFRDVTYLTAPDQELQGMNDE